MQGVDAGKFGPPRNPYAFGELPMMHTTNNAVRLYAATGDKSYLEWTGKALEQFHIAVEYTPEYAATALLAMMRYLDETIETAS